MRLRSALIFGLSLVPATALHSQSSQLDSLDAFVKEHMARRQIPGLSLAIIQDGRVVVARGYGVADETTRTPVTPATLFQAGSISKPVSAIGALHLVESGRLALDEDVNGRLTSWKVPNNRFTTTERVTLRRLLSHSAGVTVHGFAGYEVNHPMPDLIAVLNGASPANSAPIRVDTTPGAIERYSGGGFTIMQQMMIDVSGVPFARLMQTTVLTPIGMTASSFDQPQLPERAVLTASGYYADRSPVRGRWHLYPEMAAAGLWTTPTDLARFAIEIQQTLAGKSRRVISPAMARQYLTAQKPGVGLGIALRGAGPVLRFGHGGRDEGFDAQLWATAETGQGVVIMLNTNDNSRFKDRLVKYVARSFQWPEGTWVQEIPAVVRPASIEAARLAQYAGYYEVAENQMVTLVPDPNGTGLSTLADGFPDEDFLAIDSVTFGSAERELRLAFAGNSGGEGYHLIWGAGEGPRERRAPRVAPLPSSSSPVPDPDPALSARIVVALNAIQHGGSALADVPGVAAGTRQAFSGGFGALLDGVEELAYLGEEDVTGRGIRRHGSGVARVRFYRMPPRSRDRYLLVHLTAEGVVADLDLAAR